MSNLCHCRQCDDHAQEDDRPDCPAIHCDGKTTDERINCDDCQGADCPECGDALDDGACSCHVYPGDRQTAGELEADHRAEARMDDARMAAKFGAGWDD